MKTVKSKKVDPNEFIVAKRKLNKKSDYNRDYIDNSNNNNTSNNSESKGNKELSKYNENEAAQPGLGKLYKLKTVFSHLDDESSDGDEGIEKNIVEHRKLNINDIDLEISESWACSICTYLNEDSSIQFSLSKCQMCESDRH